MPKPWHVQVLHDRPVVVVRFEGRMTCEELNSAIMEIVHLCENQGIFLCLADLTAAEGGHTCFDLYRLGESLLSFLGSRPFKEALLVPMDPDARLRSRFWETYCVNRGIQVRVFTDREDAIAWLIEG